LRGVGKEKIQKHYLRRGQRRVKKDSWNGEVRSENGKRTGKKNMHNFRRLLSLEKRKAWAETEEFPARYPGFFASQALKETRKLLLPKKLLEKEKELEGRSKVGTGIP